jgi:hypothetical protein
MRYLPKITHIFFCLFLIYTTQAKEIELNISEKVEEYIKEGGVYRKSNVESAGKKQLFDFEIYALHPNKCRFPLKKLSVYEKFHEYLELVKMSGYNERNKKIFLYIDDKLLPFPMILHFKIDRIKKPGTYDFSFDKGFLKGLKGKIFIEKRGQKCLFAAKSHWYGPYSKIPDTVFEVFTETIGEIVMKKLIRISSKL